MDSIDYYYKSITVPVPLAFGESVCLARIVNTNVYTLDGAFGVGR
jgi:hypothetical protein